MNSPEALSIEEQQKSDQLLNDFIENDTSFTLLLDGLGIAEGEDMVFEDAIYGALGTGIIKRSEFKVIQKYIGNSDFEDKLEALFRSHSKEFENLGFGIDALKLVGENIKFHIDAIISKFDIYNYLGNKEEFYTHYGILLQSKHGDIIVSRDGEKVYLFVDEIFYFCDHALVDETGEMAHLLFFFPDHSIHVNYEDSRISRIEGKPVGSIVRGDVNGLISHRGDEEVLTILEIQKEMKKSKIKLEDGKTCFTDIHRIGSDRSNIVVQHVGAEIRLIGGTPSDTKDSPLTDHRIAAHVTHNISSLTDEEDVFSTVGNIVNIITTSLETYIIYETQVYYPDNKREGFSSKEVSVFAVSEYQDVISGIPVHHEVDFIKTEDDLIIINSKAENKSIYSCRNKSMTRFLTLGKIHKFHAATSEINIEYTDENGLQCFDSRDDTYYDDDDALIVDRDYH